MKLNEYSDFMQKIKCTDEFRDRMKKMLGSEPGITVCNEEKISVIKTSRKNVWIRIAAAAASFLIVCTAAVNLKNHLPSASDPSYYSTETSEVTTTYEVTGTDVTETKSDISELLSGISDGDRVCASEGNDHGRPNGSIFYYDSWHREYTVTDADVLRNELLSLEWDTCGQAEYNEAIRVYENNYVRTYDVVTDSSAFNSVTITKNGYLSAANYYFKLVNEDDISYLYEILEKYFVLTDESDLAEKITKGIKRLGNLKAHYTYEKDSGDSLSGTIMIDNESTLMYVTGEGIFEEKEVSLELVMNGDNRTVYRTTDSETSEPYLKFAYRYGAFGMIIVPNEIHYYYLCKDIENILTEDVIYTDYKTNSDFSTEYLENDNVLYHWKYRTGNGGKETAEYSVKLSLDGILLSYEISYPTGSTEKFVLDDYEINSDSFEFEKDVPALYDEIYDQLTEFEGGRSDDQSNKR